MSLKKQIIVWSVFICSFIMLASNLFNYFSSIKIMQEQMEENILGSMKQAEYNIATLTDEVDKISKIIGTNQELSFASRNVDKQSPEYANNVNQTFQTFETYLIHYEYLDGVFLRNQYDEWVGRDMKYTKLAEYETEQVGLELDENYKIIKENYPKLTLLGTFNTTDFISQSAPNKIITFARLIPRTSNSEEYILYLNIKEEWLRAVYGSGEENATESYLLQNSNQKILSSTNEQVMGIKPSYMEQIANSDKGGMFKIGRGGENKQVIYYHLEKMDLTLVREMSLSFINSSINIITKNLVIMLLISGGIIIFVYSSFMNKIVSPLYELIKAMQDAATRPGEKQIENKSHNEIGFLIRQFNTMNLEIGQLIEDRTENESRKRDLEMELMQAQINPHFLYNTMNMIKWMAKLQGADNIVESIVALSGMLKPVFSDSSLTYSIKEELEYLNNYITIMNYRYGNHIRFTVDMEFGLEVYQMLKFSLQPILENAFMHGFEQEGANGEIHLEIQKQECNIVFRVRDSGKGMSSQQIAEVTSIMRTDTSSRKKKGHVGLGNIHRRLKLTFGDNYGLILESKEGSYTLVSMEIPQILKE